MKNLLTILFLFIAKITLAVGPTNHYISPTGNDSNNGLTDSTEWLTITKVNAMFSTFAPGDSVLFERGGTYYGEIIANRSGTAALPIVIGAYGTGAKPIISGFTTAAGFTNLSGNLWKSAAITGTNSPNMVTISNVVTGMGRYPNTGWLTIGSAVGNLSITDPSLAASPSWTNASVCIREIHDVISRDSITNHTLHTITFNGLSGYNAIPGYGYILTNSLATLDLQNEWYFNRAGRQITIFSTTSPASVKVATIDTLLYIGGNDFITVNNIAFEGANVAAIVFGGPTAGLSQGITIKSVDIDNSGRDAIYCTNNMSAFIDHCTINHSLNNAILMESEGGRSMNATMTNNLIKNTGTIAGMGYWNAPGGMNTSLNAITIFGDNATVMYNEIDTTGHVPIAFYYDNVIIKYNLINYHNHITDDGGGINAFNNSPGGNTVEKGREIAWNIILNGIGAPTGTPLLDRVTHGIYMDDKSTHIWVHDNSVANSGTGGIYCHNCRDMDIENNTVYNAALSAAQFVHDGNAIGKPIRNIIFKNNLLFATSSTQLINSAFTRELSIDTMFTVLDSNIYARPAAVSGNTMKQRIKYGITGDATTLYTLTGWKAAHTTYDIHSNPIAGNTQASNYYYNFSDTTATVQFLTFRKKDARGNTFDNLATVPKYSMIILMDSGSAPVANIPPVAQAGPDKTVNLPTDTLTIFGSGTDLDGTISGYVWKLGPTTVGTSATLSLTGLTVGIYQYDLTVTDNLGATGTNRVQVSVVAAVLPQPSQNILIGVKPLNQ